MTAVTAWGQAKARAGNAIQVSMWVAGTQALEPASVIFPGALAGSWIASGAAGLEIHSHGGF